MSEVQTALPRPYSKVLCREPGRTGRQHKRWEDNIKELQTAAKDRMQWQTVIRKSLVPQQPSSGWWGNDDNLGILRIKLQFI